MHTHCLQFSNADTLTSRICLLKIKFARKVHAELSLRLIEWLILPSWRKLGNRGASKTDENQFLFNRILLY